MKYRKTQIQEKCNKITTIRFEDQRLTSFSKLVDISGPVYVHEYKTTPEEVFQSLKDIAYFRASSYSIATYCSSSAWVLSVSISNFTGNY